jgi:hypothetical protein
MSQNLDLFGHLSEPQPAGVCLAKAPKPKESPLDKALRQITDLEADLGVLESGIPPFLAQMQGRLQPLAEQRAELIRSFVVWLAEEWRRPKLSVRQKDRIQDLAFCLAERCVVDTAIDLDDVLGETGFLRHDGQLPGPGPDLEDAADDLARKALEDLMQLMGLERVPLGGPLEAHVQVVSGPAIARQIPASLSSWSSSMSLRPGLPAVWRWPIQRMLAVMVRIRSPSMICMW